VNAPGDYELALQHMMGPRAWVATVLALTGLNVSLVTLMVFGGRNPGLVISLGFLCCLAESALVCAVAGRRAHSVVRLNKALLLAGALCCFGFVGTVLAVAVALVLRLGHL